MNTVYGTTNTAFTYDVTTSSGTTNTGTANSLPSAFA